jgi:hypothetical protein
VNLGLIYVDWDDSTGLDDTAYKASLGLYYNF